MRKYFLVNEKIDSLPKEVLAEIESRNQHGINSHYKNREEQNKAAINATIPLIAPQGRVIVKADIEYKNQVAFNGGVIRRERQFNELNRRITEPVNAVIVNAENIPSGAEVLIHHNALHDTNRIFDCEHLIQGEQSTDVHFFSIKESECFLWRVGTDSWNPCTVFATALRVFEPYDGPLEGIEPKKLEKILYVTSGELKGKAVATLKACDFELIFNDENMVESRVIRFRPFGDKENDREEEATAILEEITQKINKGELLVGLSPEDAKKINE